MSGGSVSWWAPALVACGWLLAGCEKTVTSLEPVSFDEVLDPAPVVRIGGAGVTPQVSHLASGVAVRFVNEDAVAHLLTADPERWGDCPELAVLGTLQPGASSSVTVARSFVYCGFRDQANPSSLAFSGVLVVH